MAATNVTVVAPADGQGLTDQIDQPAITVGWTEGTGPYTVDYVWDDDPLFGDANGNQQTAQNTGVTGDVDTETPPAPLADTSAGTVWYLKVTVTDTADAGADTDDISVTYFASNPLDRATLYALANVGVGFTPTDDPAGGWGTGGTEGPDGDTVEQRRYLHALANVGVGFKVSDEPIEGWGTGGNPDGGDGDEITFNRYLYALLNVDTTQPCPFLTGLSTPVAREGDAVIVSGQGLVSGDDPTDAFAAEVRLYESPDHSAAFDVLTTVTWAAGETIDTITVTIPVGVTSGFVAVVHGTGATCDGSNFVFLTVDAVDQVPDAGWWVEVWTLDGQTRIIADVPVEAASFQPVLNGIGSGSITIPADYERLDEIIDPDRRGDDGSELAPTKTQIKVFMHQRVRYSFYASQIEVEFEDEAESSAVISGDGIESCLTDGAIYPQDHPNALIRAGDWLYGSTANFVTNGDLEQSAELVPNLGFEEGDYQPWVGAGSATDADLFANNVKARTGSWSLLVEPDAQGDGAQVTLNVKPGERVFIQGWVSDQVSSGQTCQMEAFYLDEDDVAQSLDTDTVTLATTWKELSVEFTVPDDITSIVLAITNEAASAWAAFHIDDVTGRNSVDPWIPNGDATLQLDDSPVADGSYSLKVEPVGLHDGALQVIRVIPGGKITIAAAVSGTAGEDVVLRAVIDGQAVTDTITLTGNPAFDVATVTGTAGQNETQIRFGLLTEEAAPSTFWVDLVSAVPGSPATSAGGIILDLLAAIQARGGLTQVSTDFTATMTSTGETWAEPSMAVSLRRGGYLSDAENTVAAFGVDWWMEQDFTLRMGNRRGIDRTNLLDCPVIRGGSDMLVGGKLIRRVPRKNVVFAEGANGIWTEASNPDDITALTRQELYLQATQAISATSLQSAADNTLDRENSRQSSLTVRLSDAQDRATPFLSFDVGDTILVDCPDVVPMAKYPEGFRVVAITVDLSSENPEYTVDLNWMVLEQHAAQAAALKLLLEKARLESVSPGAVSPSDAGGGSLIYQAPAEHTHDVSDVLGLTTGMQEGDPAGGDLGGIYPNPTVLRVRGKVVDTPTTKGDLWVYNGTKLVRLPAGSNNQVLKADSATTAGVKWAADETGGGGGGGDPFVIEPGLKPPGTPHADDDEFDQANATDPTAGAWSWGNQQSCTAAVHSGILGLDATTSILGGLHGVFKAVPATGDVSITTRATGTIRRDFHYVAIVFLWGTLATPTDLELVRLTYASGDIEPYWSRYTAYATFSANRGQVERTGISPQFLRLEWDDSASTVLGLWTPRATASALSFSALGTAQAKGSRPDFMGVAVGDDSTSNNLPIALFDFFRVNWTPDYDPTT